MRYKKVFGSLFQSFSISGLVDKRRVSIMPVKISRVVKNDFFNRKHNAVALKNKTKNEYEVLIFIQKVLVITGSRRHPDVKGKEKPGSVGYFC